MFDASSRHASQPQRERVEADGRVVRFVRARWVPEVGLLAEGERHRVSDSDRADVLAWKAFGVPQAWWMIADANAVVHPRGLTDSPGETLVLPLPGTGGVPG